MQNVYFDNAATTWLDQLVLDAMMPYFVNGYGNPSAIHSGGRVNRLAIEESRKMVAQLLDCQPAEIFFTASGTESTNTIINGAIRSLGCKFIITSPIEHHATLFTAEVLCKEFNVKLLFATHKSDGTLDYEYLNKLINDCSQKGATFVSIMHANNEIGIINDIDRIGKMCLSDLVFFHTDMVQTVGHLPISLRNINVDFISASAHKFHGPMGTGAMYVNSNVKINPYIYGGGQERNLRAGTENVPGIVGFAKALEFAIADMAKENKHTLSLKKYCLDRLKENFPDIIVYGTIENSLQRTLSVSLEQNGKTEMLQMSLDIKGIAVSGGSACSSGALGGSHVIKYVTKTAVVPLRISFNKWNTKDEIDYLIESMVEILN